MKLNYKPIGKYIQEVKVRNVNNKTNNLLGININKYYMPSVANIVGTDLSVYKLVSKGQFACNLMHVGRDMRLPVALSTSEEDFIVSPAYDVFEIIDTKVLSPEYLMMWFTRREFDRNAWFYTDADVRGGLSWTAFCEMQLPVPSIKKQKEIVAEYNTIQNRLDLNKQLIQKLEETAKAIYKNWFVDFEFPDENGKPYKRNGGEMVESELGEIPKRWEVKSLNLLCEITSSKRIFEDEYTKDGIPFFRGKEVTLRKAGEPITEPIYISLDRYNNIIENYGKPSHGDILMTAVGTLGSTYMIEPNQEFYFKDGNVIWFKNFVKTGLNYFIYDFMQSDRFNDIINEITIGSTQNAITITTFGQQKIIVPNQIFLEKYVELSEKINEAINAKRNQNLNLLILKNLLLSKLSTIEN